MCLDPKMSVLRSKVERPTKKAYAVMPEFRVQGLGFRVLGGGLGLFSEFCLLSFLSVGACVGGVSGC